MDYFNVGWLIALAAFAAGIGVGAIFYKLKFSDDARAQKLQDELDQLNRDFESYKNEISAHFSKTSELVSNLTEDYVKVYKHLAESAESLADVRILPQLSASQSSPMISFINEVEEISSEAVQETAVEAPKDYAPKEDEDEGTLSESYSLGPRSKPEDQEKESA